MLELGPRLVLPSVIEWISATIAPVAKKKRAAKAEHIHRFITDAFFNQRPHESPLRFADIVGVNGLRQFTWAQSFTEKELKKGLGGNEGDYRQFVRLFFDFPESNMGYDRGAGMTKPYVLKQEAVERMTEAWRDTSDAFAVDEMTGTVLTPSDFPANGVVRTSFSSAAVPALLRLDEDLLSANIDSAEARQPISSDYPADQGDILALRHAYAARQWVRALRGMPNLYADYQLAKPPTSGTGRLYGLGLNHVQRQTRKARQLVLSGSGWTDFDFRACHPTLLLALMRAWRCGHQAWSEYLDDRDGWHGRIANRLDVPDAKIKAVVNALLYGQTLSSNPRSSLSNMIGPAAADRLRGDKDYLALRAELVQARREVIDRHRTGQVIRNAVGKELPVQTKPVTLLSLVLTGYEAWGINSLCGTGGQGGGMWPNGDEIQVIIHDGWIASSLPSANLELLLDSYAVLEFGFPLSLRIKTMDFG